VVRLALCPTASVIVHTVAHAVLVRSPTGFTLIEILIALMVVGLVAMAGFRVVMADVATDATQVAARLRVARMMRVVGDASSAAIACIRPPDGIRARIVAWPPRGLLFTPDGLPRTCDGGGVGNTTILLEYRGRQAAVIVSSLGRIRWEMR
jgi:prepilin-type N-terminal cleavage/methylation domain-containing protein